MGALLADRAEQQAAEAAEPARAEHEQVGLDPGCQQRLDRRTLDDGGA